MKTLKSIFLLFFAIILTACKTINVPIEQKRTPEEILAIATTENKIYAIGRLHSYEFEYSDKLKTFSERYGLENITNIWLFPISYDTKTQNVSTYFHLFYKTDRDDHIDGGEINLEKASSLN